MNSPEDLVIIGAFILIGGFVFFYGFVKMRQYRIIRDTPRSKIRSMAMGIVEIHGHVEPDQLIISPLSRTNCVYYKYEIKEYRRTKNSKSGSSSRWVTVGSGDKRVPFLRSMKPEKPWSTRSRRRSTSLIGRPGSKRTGGCLVLSVP